MKTIEVKCDHCGGDLTDAGPRPTYRLALSPEAVPNSGDFLYALHVTPPIARPHHFCGLDCLDLWRDRERHYNARMRERYDAWAEEHGTKVDGRGLSYPSPPTETQEIWKAESREAALRALPVERPHRR